MFRQDGSNLNLRNVSRIYILLTVCTVDRCNILSSFIADFQPTGREILYNHVNVIWYSCTFSLTLRINHLSEEKRKKWTLMGFTRAHVNTLVYRGAGKKTESCLSFIASIWLVTFNRGNGF